MVKLGCNNPLKPGEETITTTDLTIQTLAGLIESLPVGTNLALLQFMLFPALKATGLSDAAVRRAWAAMRGGVWHIAVLLRLWQGHIEGLPDWRYHRHEGYRAVNVESRLSFARSSRIARANITTLQPGKPGRRSSWGWWG
jgi:hypothetical protein